MTTVSSMPRQPFGVLDSPRLAHLSGIKNRQDGIAKTLGPLSVKAKMVVPTSFPSVKPSAKRRLPPSFDEVEGHAEDAENVNPNTFFSRMKRTKMDVSSASLSTPPSSFDFTFAPTKPTSPTTCMPPPSRLSTRIKSGLTKSSTPIRYSGVTKSSTRTPLTAPAGRSPKSKRNQRRLGAHPPFTRIDPLALSRSSARVGLPFSIDAALPVSLKTPAPAVTPLPKPASSIEESMPRSWFFAIHEDTAEEEAEILMEHSTLTLDLSSDDESTTKANQDRGKENVAPADYDPIASSSSSTRPSRRTLKSANDMDTDEASRAPLGSLDTAEFVPEGLTKDSIITVHELPETCTLEAPVAKEDKECTPLIFISPPKQVGIADVKDHIFIFEDEPASPALSTGGKCKKSVDDDDDE